MKIINELSSWLKGFSALFGQAEIRRPMSDSEALAADWAAIGNDMRAAIKIVKNEKLR